MIPKIIKLFASILLLAYGVYQITETFVGNGIFLIILSILLVVLYFKNEVLIFAFLSLRKQNFDRTEKILKLIKKKLYLNGVKKIDYIEPLDLKTLKKPKDKKKFNLFFALYIGKVRFIDNF